MMPCDANKPTFEETRGQSVEALLASRVPYLHFELFVPDSHELHFEVNGNRRQVTDREVALLETLEKTSFSYAAFAHD